MHLRHLISPHRLSPSHLQLPPASQATKNYHHSLEPEDAVTLRARVICFYLTSKESTNADNVFGMLHQLIEHISDSNASKKEVRNALKGLAMLSNSPQTRLGAVSGICLIFRDVA